MSLARSMGPLEEIGENPKRLECEHPSPCPEDPVARVPRPNELTAKGMTLCSFHLALWIDTVDEHLDREVAQLADSDALLQLENIPPWTGHRGHTWSRLGIDHHGEAHYYRELDDSHEDTARIILLDHNLKVQDDKKVPGHLDVGDWIQYVRENRGWVRLDHAARRKHEGGDQR